MKELSADFLSELQGRQKRFLNGLGSKACLVASGYEKRRNSDVFYRFRQASDFWYLTGFPEQDSLAFFDPNHESENYVLFVRESDKFRELWDGRRYGLEGGKEVFKADAVYAISEIEEVLAKRVSAETLTYFVEKGHCAEEAIKALVAEPVLESQKLVRDLLDNMRLIKSTWEVAQLREANKITSRAHQRMMRKAPTASYEYELQAEFDYVCTQAGYRTQAYSNIVASGANNCCLHYGENDDVVKSGDLVLVDAGAEVNLYAADITRTFPVSGRFTEPQKAIYQLVLDAQQAAFDAISPTATLKNLHEASTNTLTSGLIDLGIFKGSVEENVENGNIRRFYPHGTGHFLGLDVHDVGGRLPYPMQTGMAFTVEPGLYFQTYDEMAPDEFKGIGVRIEDNIVITENGFENLSLGCVKEVADVEELIQSANA